MVSFANKVAYHIYVGTYILYGKKFAGINIFVFFVDP